MVGGPLLIWRSPFLSGLRRMRRPRCMWRWLVWCEAGAVGSLGEVLGSRWPWGRSVRLPITCWMRRAARLRRSGSWCLSACCRSWCWGWLVCCCTWCWRSVSIGVAVRSWPWNGGEAGAFPPFFLVSFRGVVCVVGGEVAASFCGSVGGLCGGGGVGFGCGGGVWGGGWGLEVPMCMLCVYKQIQWCIVAV